MDITVLMIKLSVILFILPTHLSSTTSTGILRYTKGATQSKIFKPISLKQDYDYQKHQQISRL